MAGDNGTTNTTYTSDAFGRNITTTVNGVTQTYAYDSLDRVTTSNGSALQYDDQSNNAVSTPAGAASTVISRNPDGTPMSSKTGQLVYQQDIDGITITRA